MKRITHHISFWLAVWLFRGYLQYSSNKFVYGQLTILKQLQLNFTPELLIVLVKMGVCYAIAHLFKKQANWFTPIILIQAITITVFGVALRQLVLSTWINLGDKELPLINLDALFQTTRIMNSITDLGFTLGIFMLLKNYGQQLQWAKKEKELIREKFQAELDFLKAQTNPHFLFNTLNNMFSMAQASKNDMLADSIDKLSSMMRYTLYDSSVRLISVEKEIEYINNFIRLTKLRFRDEEVMVNLEYRGNLIDSRIPPMILMPFVENAFKHGVVVNKQSSVVISISIHENILFFSCINNKYENSRKKNDTSHGIGLNNIKRRLELIYPDKHTLIIEEKDDLYTVNLIVKL